MDQGSQLADVTAELGRFTQLFEQAPTFMALLDGPTHIISHVNPGYQRLVGDRQVVGRTIAAALPDAAAQGYVALLERVYSTGEAYSAVGARYDVEDGADGQVRETYVDFVYQPMRNAAGVVTGIFVEGVDVTLRVRAERRREALVRLTDELRSVDEPDEIGYAASRVLGEVLDVSRVGYGAIDDKDWLHVAKDWNAPGVPSLAGSLPLRDYGSFVDSLRANEFIAISDVRTDPRTSAAAPALEGRNARSFVNYPVLENGRLVGVLFINHAEVRQWRPEDLAMFRELAERTHTALSRAQATQQLRRVNSTLEAQVEERTSDLRKAEAALRQSQKMEAVGQLTGGLAHDFNNILAGIGGSLELMAKRLVQGRLSDVDRYLQAAQGATKRAANLTQRLLAFARRQTLVPTPSKLADVVDDMLDLIGRSVGPNIQIEISSAPDLWNTFADVGQVENALLNLCVNARDAMPRGGKILIATANVAASASMAGKLSIKPGDYVTLCIQDEGTGMPPDVLERATEPFFTTKPIGQGTGLGLSMVYGFAAQSGGAVKIASEVGKGTTVTLYLPRYAGDAVTASLEASAPAPTAIEVTRTILLVDDEVLVRMVVADQLTELGYSILEAGDARAALQIAQQSKQIDLLLTDVGLPAGLNGRQLADAILETRPDLPVIFITGYAEHSVLNSGDLGRRMRVLTKPFQADELAQMVREVTIGS